LIDPIEELGRGHRGQERAGREQQVATVVLEEEGRMLTAPASDEHGDNRETGKDSTIDREF